MIAYKYLPHTHLPKNTRHLHAYMCVHIVCMFVCLCTPFAYWWKTPNSHGLFMPQKGRSPGIFAVRESFACAVHFAPLWLLCQTEAVQAGCSGWALDGKIRKTLAGGW